MTRYKSWLFLLAALLLAACSKDSEQAGGDLPDPGPVLPETKEAPLSLFAATRMAVIDAGEAYDPIHIFLMSGETATTTTHKTEGQFIYDGTWKSTIGVKNPHNCIYGFSPATAASATISTSSTYNNGAVLTLKNISPVTGSDICVIVGIKHGTSAADVAGVPDQGNFYFEKGVYNHVSLLLDHLFAKIDFSVRIDADYHKMRAIKVKKIELLSDKTLKEVAVPLTANADNNSPIGTITYAVENVTAGAERPSGIIYDYNDDTNPDHSDGVDLPEDASWTIPGYFAPGGEAEGAIGRHLLLRFTYDIYAYDVFNNNKCTRVRENCEAINSLSDVSGLAGLLRGQSTTITLTVKPTYLYALSESELNNPAIVVNSD
ncbi:MAG: hypothetical protein IK075_12140 [Prevotella sp.]|nr:hypothetical protein [Prevotella sp.]